MINPITIGARNDSSSATQSVRLTNLMAFVSMLSTAPFLVIYILASQIPAVFVSCCGIICYLLTLLYNHYQLFKLARIWQLLFFSIHLFVLASIVFTRETGLHYILFIIPPAAFLIISYKNYFDKIILSSIAFIFILVCEFTTVSQPMVVLSDAMNRALTIFSVVSLFLGLTAFVWLFTYGIHHYQRSREALIAKLDKSLKEITQLQGILPICANCKKIRDDKGYWNQIESYISDHSEAVFSHSICPECAAELYPELGHREKAEQVRDG